MVVDRIAGRVTSRDLPGVSVLRARTMRALPEGQSCAFVRTIAHDEIANPQKRPRYRAENSAFRPDCRNSFCALGRQARKRSYVADLPPSFGPGAMQE